MMIGIYSCKLYKASNRKDKIRAAIQNPMNAELVTQLSSYLDEEFQQSGKNNQINHDLDVDSKTPDVDTDTDSNDTHFSSPSHVTTPSGNFSSSSDVSDSLESEVDIPSELDIDVTTEDTEGVNVDESEEDDVPITEATELNTSESDLTFSESGVSFLKNLLESNHATFGVSHILIKNGELWIHYNDSINLNNVMSSVIELLSSKKYDCLEFNRLARSTNAIVFQIIDRDDIQNVNPVEVDIDDSTQQ